MLCSTETTWPSRLTSSGRREGQERFANAFAAEFLVPIAALRSAVEAFGEAKVTDAETVVHLQRLFGVSYAMMLVRLRAANLLNASDDARMREIQPGYQPNASATPPTPTSGNKTPRAGGPSELPRGALRDCSAAPSMTAGSSIAGAAQMTGLAIGRRSRGVRLRPRTAGWHEGRTSSTSTQPRDVVCNTTPVRIFAITGQFDLLAEAVGGTVRVPREVLDPEEDPDLPEALLSEVGRAQRYFSKRSVRRRGAAAARTPCRMCGRGLTSEIIDLEAAEQERKAELTSARDRGVARPRCAARARRGCGDGPCGAPRMVGRR